MKTTLFIIQALECFSIFFWFRITEVPFYAWRNGEKKIFMLSFLQKFVLIYFYPFFLAWAFWEAWLSFYTHQFSFALIYTFIPLLYFIFMLWYIKTVRYKNKNFR